MTKSSLTLLTATVLAGGTLNLYAFERVQFNHPGLTVDLGVGLWAWPLPMDWDGDGDYDLIVSCPDEPYNGTYFFENTHGDAKLPVFKPGIKVGVGMKNLQVSHVNGVPHVLQSSKAFTGFLGVGFGASKRILETEKVHKGEGRDRFNVWSYVDYDGDGAQDIMVGADDWGYYGWDDGFDKNGNWKRGPLHGYVYILRNAGTTVEPEYEKPFRLQAGGEEANVYGNPQPNMADFDGDGDLDLICGEFLDGFTYFQNIGSRTEPAYSTGRYLMDGKDIIRMHVQMITPSAIDWDKDGDVDIICGDEDGRVALVENTGKVRNGQPSFKQPQYFQQEARDLKFGALVTPVSFDWDADGDEDLICGNTSGNIAFIENLDGGNPPRWAGPVLLEAGGRVIRIQAGDNGSIQGPAEAKWGYSTLSVADWNHDSLPDLVVNSIWGKVIWHKNIGTKAAPNLAAAQPVKVAWRRTPPKPAWTWWNPQSGELAPQWRTTPVVVDWDEDGLNDLIMLDHEGYLSFFRREKRGDALTLHPGNRIFRGGVFDSKHSAKGKADDLLQMNNRINGGSGRRKICIVDWDGDGLRDLLVNSVNVNFMKNKGEKDRKTWFKDMGPVSNRKLAGHTTSPTTVDWNNDGIRDLLVGAEDGRLYYVENPRAK